MNRKGGQDLAPIPTDAVVVRSNRVVANELNSDETVMLDVDKGTYFGVREIGKVIWETVAQPTSIDDLVAVLLERYEVDEQTCRNEVLAFLDDLADQGLLDIEAPTPRS
jgi:hypothetical protein